MFVKYLAECLTYGQSQINGSGCCFTIVALQFTIIVILVTVWRTLCIASGPLTGDPKNLFSVIGKASGWTC